MAEKSNVPYDTISRLSVSSRSVFSKCCCCIPLRLGCFILGYLNLIINIFQTLGLIAITTFIGVSTHGFDHFDHVQPGQDSDEEISTDFPDSTSSDALRQPVLTYVGFLLVLIVIANVCWLIINIVCLVGLHKRRPGPIRVYVGFASARLMLAMVGFIYLMMSNKAEAHHIVSHCIDLGFTAYFVLVYYIYAVQLEKERAAEIAAPAPVNNVFIYPTNLDKSHLVEINKQVV